MNDDTFRDGKKKAATTSQSSRSVESLLVFLNFSISFFLFFFFSFISLIADGPHHYRILPVVTKDLPISPGSRLTFFLSRCKFSTLTTRQPMVEFYLLTFPRFPLRKKEHKSYCGKNRTYDFRTSRCAAYLLDHSGEELAYWLPTRNTCVIYIVLANPAACFLSSACKFHLIISWAWSFLSPSANSVEGD